MSRPPQVEGHRIFVRAFFLRQFEKAWRVAGVREARQPPRLRFIRVYGRRLVVASGRMRDMVDAAAQRAAAPRIENVEGQRGMHIDRRVQSGRQLPSLEAYAGDTFAGTAGGAQRNASSVARDRMAPGIKTLDPYLQTFDGGVDGARGGGRAGVFAQHMPRLERVAQFKCDATMGDGAIERKAKFALGLKPLRIEMIAGGGAQIVQHTEKVVPDEMLQHEPIVQGRAPADGGAALRLAPEPGDQRAHEQ